MQFQYYIHDAITTGLLRRKMSFPIKNNLPVRDVGFLIKNPYTISSDLAYSFLRLNVYRSLHRLIICCDGKSVVRSWCVRQNGSHGSPFGFYLLPSVIRECSCLSSVSVRVNLIFSLTPPLPRAVGGNTP